MSAAARLSSSDRSTGWLRALKQWEPMNHAGTASASKTSTPASTAASPARVQTPRRRRRNLRRTATSSPERQMRLEIFVGGLKIYGRTSAGGAPAPRRLAARTSTASGARRHHVAERASRHDGVERIAGHQDQPGSVLAPDRRRPRIDHGSGLDGEPPRSPARKLHEDHVARLHAFEKAKVRVPV